MCLCDKPIKGDPMRLMKWTQRERNYGHSEEESVAINDRLWGEK